MTQGARTALITGSGRNIGRAIALHLARAGLNIVLNGSSDSAACEQVAGEARELGVQALVAMGNIGEREHAKAVAEAALAQFGRIDVLVNNAAVRPNGGFLELSETEWQRVYDINFGGAFWLCRACLPAMVENGWGRIINFTGMNAQQGYPGKPHVTVSKHAVWGLTKSLAKEFGPKGITTNIISPGTIIGEYARPSESEQQRMLSSNPAGRLGKPDDIAAMVGLLISEQGSFINGQLLQINGGVVC